MRLFKERDVSMNQDIDRVIFDEVTIANRVQELGRQISEDYAGESLLVVGILKGAVIFMSDLIRRIDVPVEMDFMSVSSYGSAAKSSGTVNILKDLSTSIEGRNVLIVEDVLDSGLTLSRLMEELGKRNPKSLAAAVLLRKSVSSQADVYCRYIGFECPDEFVVGCGLDYAQAYRHLPYIGILKREVYE